MPKAESRAVESRAVSKAARSKAAVSKAAVSSTPECNVAVLHGVVRVPVSWIGSATQVPELVADEAVVVVGHVARRFFQTQTGLASRVDVRARQLVNGAPARRRKAIVAAQSLLS